MCRVCGTAAHALLQVMKHRVKATLFLGEEGKEVVDVTKCNISKMDAWTKGILCGPKVRSMDVLKKATSNVRSFVRLPVGERQESRRRAAASGGSGGGGGGGGGRQEQQQK